MRKRRPKSPRVQRIINKCKDDVIRLVNLGHSITEAVRIATIKHDEEYDDNIRRAFSRELEEGGITNNKEKQLPLEQTEEYLQALNRKLSKSKYYIVTCAQAETPVHENFWNGILSFAKELNASIIVQATRYKNPNSLESSNAQKNKEKNKNIWDSRVREYLYASRLDICSGLQVLCDVKVQPTAALPLSGLNGFTGEKTTILPHPRVHLESLPVLPGYNSKLILSTGAVTVSNYTDTKAGKKGEFHHQLGFAIVEVDEDETFHIRQIQADDNGNFYDIFHKVQDGQVTRITEENVEEGYTAIFGDIHGNSVDYEALNAAIDISQRLNMDNIVLHDLLDGESINHHHDKDPFELMRKENNGSDNLFEEINDTISLLDSLINYLPTATFHNIASNHNDFLDRWLRDVDWRKVRNKKAYLEFANIVANGEAKQGVFNYIINQRLPQVKTYGYGDSLRIHDWELALHGDRGANGSRGGIKQFKNLSTKTISAHTHSPKREDGSIIVGTLTKLRLGYNTGLSSWMQGIGITFPNGKTTHVHIINGKYTTLI